MSKKNELSKKNAQKWANALRSGAYPQTKGTLEDGNGYCCLGVACDLFIPQKNQVKGWNSDYLKGNMPEEQVHAPKWLKTIEKGLAVKMGDGFSELNDDHDFTFDEIADVIELVYVHKAL